MTCQLENMPCLARLKAMDILPGQHGQVGRPSFYAFTKLACPVKVPEDQSQARLNVPSAGYLLWICTQELQVTGAWSRTVDDRYCSLLMRRTGVGISTSSHQSCKLREKSYA